MGLSPRKMNEYAKELLRERGINPARSLSPAARRAADYHRIPTERLIARLGLMQYVSHSLPELVRLVPEEIFCSAVAAYRGNQPFRLYLQGQG